MTLLSDAWVKYGLVQRGTLSALLTRRDGAINAARYWRVYWEGGHVQRTAGGVCPSP